MTIAVLTLLAVAVLPPHRLLSEVNADVVQASGSVWDEAWAIAALVFLCFIGGLLMIRCVLSICSFNCETIETQASGGGVEVVQQAAEVISASRV
mgnify:CR=1 FL=1|jgi:hypothetical protein